MDRRKPSCRIELLGDRPRIMTPTGEITNTNLEGVELQILTIFVADPTTRLDYIEFENWTDESLTSADFEEGVNRLREALPDGAIRAIGRGTYRVDDSVVATDVWELEHIATEANPDNFDLETLQRYMRPLSFGHNLKSEIVDELDNTVHYYQTEIVGSITRLPFFQARKYHGILTRYLDQNGLLNESVVAYVAKSLAFNGHRTDALNLINDAKRSLGERAGLDLQTELQALERDLLEGRPLDSGLSGPPRAALLETEAQGRTRSALEPVSAALQAVIDSDESLSVEDEMFIRAQLNTIRAQSSLEEAGDPEIIERAISHIVRRFLSRMHWGDVARTKLADLGAEPEELIERICVAINSTLEQIVDAGVADPKEDGEILRTGGDSAERARGLISELRSSTFGQEFEKKMGTAAAAGVSALITYLGLRLGPGFETVALRLVESWPVLVEAFTGSSAGLGRPRR